jgi:hypothetical protein
MMAEPEALVDGEEKKGPSTLYIRSRNKRMPKETARPSNYGGAPAAGSVLTHQEKIMLLLGPWPRPAGRRR